MDNFRDTESSTSYSFELQVKCHKVHRGSDWWLQGESDSVKHEALAHAHYAFHIVCDVFSQNGINL